MVQFLNIRIYFNFFSFRREQEDSISRMSNWKKIIKLFLDPKSKYWTGPVGRLVMNQKFCQKIAKTGKIFDSPIWNK